MGLLDGPKVGNDMLGIEEGIRVEGRFEGGMIGLSEGKLNEGFALGKADGPTLGAAEIGVKVG